VGASQCTGAAGRGRHGERVPASALLATLSLLVYMLLTVMSSATPAAPAAPPPAPGAAAAVTTATAPSPAPSAPPQARATSWGRPTSWRTCGCASPPTPASGRMLGYLVAVRARVPTAPQSRASHGSTPPPCTQNAAVQMRQVLPGHLQTSPCRLGAGTQAAVLSAQPPRATLHSAVVWMRGGGRPSVHLITRMRQAGQPTSEPTRTCTAEIRPATYRKSSPPLPKRLETQNQAEAPSSARAPSRAAFAGGAMLARPARAAWVLRRRQGDPFTMYTIARFGTCGGGLQFRARVRESVGAWWHVSKLPQGLDLDWI